MMNFTIIENDIMDKPISDGAYRLYSILKSYCFGEKTTCFPCQITLGKRMRKSVRTIQRYIDELINSNLIKKKRRGSISNQYEIIRKAIDNKVSKLKEKCQHKSAQKQSIGTSYFREKPKGSFGNFHQRNYNFSNLEALLTGRKPNLTYEDCIIHED